jgi:hypothetical protein
LKLHGFVGDVATDEAVQPKIVRAEVTTSVERQLKDAVCFIWLHFMSKQGKNLLNHTHDKEAKLLVCSGMRNCSLRVTEGN